jgi:hypothetical protein
VVLSLVFLVVLAANVATAIRLQRVLRLVVFDEQLWTVWLRAQSAEDFDREIFSRQANHIEPEAELLLMGAIVEPNASKRRFLINEALLDIEADLLWGEGIPRAAVRIALLVTAFGTVWSFLIHRTITLHVLDVMVVGGAGWMLIVAMGRQAERIARKKKIGIDKLVDVGVRFFSKLDQTNQAR